MPFIFFLTVLGIFYIANSYVSEKAIREIDKTSKDIKDLRSEYITVKSELMFKSRQSEVSKSVLPLGIKHLIVPPKKIIVKKNNSPNSELLTAN
jgi:DNA-binding transcriptional regulator GbsR (MarR family)